MIYSCVSIFSILVDKRPKLAQLDTLSQGVTTTISMVQSLYLPFIVKKTTLFCHPVIVNIIILLSTIEIELINSSR